MDCRRLRGALILADDSAEYRLAGISQLERLLLALNEYVEKTKSPQALPVCVLGDKTDFRYVLPSNPRLTSVSISSDYDGFVSKMADSADPILVMSTHLVVRRNGIALVVQALANGESAPALLIGNGNMGDAAGFPSALAARLSAREKAASLGASVAEEWIYLKDKAGKRGAADLIWRNAGKPQDGFVSRHLNRPLSSRVSRLLAKLPVRPNQWTLLLMTIPIAGSFFLVRGDYFGFAFGAVLFELHSILDGCDGEIARVKYLESETGYKLDGICDRLATMFYAVCLGIGLSHQPAIAKAMSWFYPLEGVMAALLIGISETWLQQATIEEGLSGERADDNPYRDYIQSHRRTFNPGDQLKVWIIKHSGMLFLGERATLLFGELTKRDVFNLGFLLLALCGRPAWILHILAVVAGVILVSGLKSLFVTRLSGARVVRAAD